MRAGNQFSLGTRCLRGSTYHLLLHFHWKTLKFFKNSNMEKFLSCSCDIPLLLLSSNSVFAFWSLNKSDPSLMAAFRHLSQSLCSSAPPPPPSAGVSLPPTTHLLSLNVCLCTCLHEDAGMVHVIEPGCF